jgi:hypothetical protein
MLNLLPFPFDALNVIFSDIKHLFTTASIMARGGVVQSFILSDFNN